MKEFFLDLIYPKYCIGCKKFGAYICDDCFAGIQFARSTACAICQHPSIDGMTHPRCLTPHKIDGIIAGVEYRGVIKKLVYQLKYKPFVRDLATPAADLLYESLIQNEAAMKYITSDTTITSVPLSGKRRKKRGYNQAEEIAKKLAMKFEAPYTARLRRTKDTYPQFDLKKKERLKNIQGAFEILKNAPISCRVLLVDDVATTGSTMRECAKVLKRNGAQHVLGIAFAREK